MNIQFYIERDGEDSAHDTVKLHFVNYLEAVANPKAHASTRDYRSKFIDSLQTMADYLGHAVARALMESVRDRMLERARRTGTELNAYVRLLNHAVRCNFATMRQTLDELRPYPADVVGAPQEVRLSTLSVEPDDYLRAVALLEEAGITVS